LEQVQELQPVPKQQQELQPAAEASHRAQARLGMRSNIRNNRIENTQTPLILFSFRFGIYRHDAVE
jgi:hypothetical protein